MRATPYKCIVLLDGANMLDGILPSKNEVFIAACAWRERYNLDQSHLPDDVLVSKFITDEELSDEELSKVYLNSYSLFRYLEKLLIHSQRGLVTDIHIGYYIDGTVSITISGYGV